MSKAGAIAGRTLIAALVLAGLASGQTRGRPAKGPAKPKPAASSSAENPYEGTPPPGPVPSASAPPPAPAAASDPGAIAPPWTAETADGGRLSPLNPAPNEFSEAGPPAASVDYDRLLSDIAALRARVAAVSDTLFHSRMGIALETSGEHGRIATLTVSLDDGVVWTSPPAFRADDMTTVYEHAVAPGHHGVTVDVERRDDHNDVFRSTQRSRFTVDVPGDQQLAVEVKIWDDSNMGADFPTDKKGQYELRIRARASAKPLPR
jgi:hypothetical protein